MLLRRGIDFYSRKSGIPVLTSVYLIADPRVLLSREKAVVGKAEVPACFEQAENRTVAPKIV
jgi:hypothetical protein